MSLFDEILEDIESKKIRREKGWYNGIPFPFKRYHDYIPSIDKGMYYGYLGGTGTGKSRLIRYTHIYETVKFSMNNNYPVKILYFALEDSRKSAYKKIMTHYLWERQQLIVPQKVLDSKDEPIPQKYLDVIKMDRKFYEAFERSVWIVNDATSPSEIFNRCKQVHDKYGKTHHIIAIIDNYSNITRDPHHGSEWEAVKELSRNMIRLELCKEMGLTVVAVLQTDMETEKNSFRNSGKAPITALEPNMGSIGDIKVIARDIFTLFALFNPWRYEITSYPFADETRNYNIDVLRNRFRSLLMLKNNEGEMAPRLGLYFDGLKEVFTEMPLPTESDQLNTIYQKIIQEERERKEKITKGKLF